MAVEGDFILLTLKFSTMKLLIKFIYILSLFNTTLSLCAQLDTLYTEDFTDQEYEQWEVSDPETQRLVNTDNGLIFEADENNSVDVLTSPTLNLNIYESITLVTNDLFDVGAEDSLTLSISENGGDNYNIHFDLKTIESDTINLSSTLTYFDNIKFKYTIIFNDNSKNAQFWSIQSCQILGRNILGGVAKVAGDDGNDDRERFYYECLSVGEELNLSLVLTNDLDSSFVIESLDIFVTADNPINWDISTVPITIISKDKSVINQITGIDDSLKLNVEEKARFNIPMMIEGIASDDSYNDMHFIFYLKEAPYIIRGSLTTKIGNCCQEEAYSLNSQDEPLPYFLKTNSHIKINDMRPLDTNEKSILTAIDYILLEPKDTTQFISIYNQFSDSKDVFIARMSKDTCIFPVTTPINEGEEPVEKVSNKTKLENTTVHIYPNPTTQTLNFNITSEADNKFINIEIINTIGNIVLKKKMDNSSFIFFELNINSLPNGLYYAKIYNSNFVETKKFYKR